MLTPRKVKLQKELTHYKNLFGELSHEYEKLKKHSEKQASLSLTLEHFHLLCDKFLKNEISAFIQIQSILTNISPVGHRYSSECKQFALMIHFLGPQVYRFLQKSWCLPTVRTLQKVIENWEINPGLSDFLFSVLSMKANSMLPKSKECVLCVDEMSLKSFLFYNFKKDEIVGFHNTGYFKTYELAKSVMVVMIRGLNDSWKQPIGYFFVASSCTGYNLENVIFKYISRLDSISINIKVIISDLGSNFKKFADQLNVTHETPYFNVGDNEIVFMFDPNHLLKATRNNFFKYRFKSGTKVAEKIHFQNFYKYDKSSHDRLAPKLTEVHMNPNKFQKMKVKFAAQTFSHTVVAGMGTLISCQQLPNTAIDTINFIDSMDKLFDIFNSQPMSRDISNKEGENDYNVKRYCLPFTKSDFQIDFLNSMEEYFQNLQLQNFSALQNIWVNINECFNVKFINAWLISIAGLKRLYHNLSKTNSSLLKLYTYRLNQDCLEKFFGNIRNQNRNCINPTCIQFQRTFKKLFCLNYLEYNEDANCIQDFDEVLTSLGDIPAYELKTLFPEKNPVVIPLSICDTDNYKSLNIPKQNALTYICDYLISQCLKKHECPTYFSYAQSPTTVSSENFYSHFKAHLTSSTSNFGNLIMLNSKFYQYIFQLDQMFIKHFPMLAPHPNVGKSLKDLISNSIFFHHSCKNFPIQYLINLFLRLRIFNSLTKTNKQYVSSAGKRNNKIQVLAHL